MILETRHSIVEILSRQRLFRGLDELSIQRLADACLEYRTGKGEVLFQKGGKPQGLHIVVSGQVKLALPSAQGSEKIVRLAGPGDIFGEEAVLLDKPYTLAAQATRDGILLILGRAGLMAVLAENPSLCCAMMTNLATRMHELIDNMETCTQRSSAQRVAHYLTRLAPEADDGFEVELDANKQTIASQLNLAPETFSRVLSRLASDGCIQLHGRTIRIADSRRLRMHAC